MTIESSDPSWEYDEWLPEDEDDEYYYDDRQDDPYYDNWDDEQDSWEGSWD